LQGADRCGIPLSAGGDDHGGFHARNGSSLGIGHCSIEAGENGMRNLIIALAIIAAAAFFGSDRSGAMTLAAPAGLDPAIEATQSLESVLYLCHRVRQCGPAGCEWRRVCPRGCPDSVSCFPLYGAYGPWGGRAYWGAYSYPYYPYYPYGR
jgi:hypothetical protein